MMENGKLDKFREELFAIGEGIEEFLISCQNVFHRADGNNSKVLQIVRLTADLTVKNVESLAVMIVLAENAKDPAQARHVIRLWLDRLKEDISATENHLKEFKTFDSRTINHRVVLCSQKMTDFNRRFKLFIQELEAFYAMDEKSVSFRSFYPKRPKAPYPSMFL